MGMITMNPVETLKHEHKIVLLGLKGTERIAQVMKIFQEVNSHESQTNRNT